MPEETKKKRLDSDGRATASAMTGHTRTYYDDRYYRWLRDKSGAQSPPRIGASGVNVSGGLAPHHMFGLKLMKNLTAGMSPEDIADINDNYMPVGYRMGDDADWNLIGIEQDVNSGEGTNSGWHKQVHDSQDELLKKLGFKKTKKGYLFNGKPFEDLPTQVRKDLISYVTHEVEMDTERVLRQASDDFWNRPQEVVDADLAEIRRTSAAAPPPPPQDYRPTRKATQVMQSQEWADAQDSTAWDRIRASELDNKNLQRLARSPGLQNVARALGKIKKTKLGVVAGGITGSVMSAKPGLADAKTLADATSSGDYTQLAVDTGVGAASGAVIQAGLQKATQAGMGWLGNAARALGTPLAALSTGKAIADVTFNNEKVQRAYASADNPLDRWKALGAAWMSEEDFYGGKENVPTDEDLQKKHQPQIDAMHERDKDKPGYKEYMEAETPMERWGAVWKGLTTF